MRADPDAVASLNGRAEYLREHTGHRSWASVIVGSQQFLCLHCHEPFDPTEQATAHHYARKCLGFNASLPTYLPGASSAAPTPEPAV